MKNVTSYSRDLQFLQRILHTDSRGDETKLHLHRSQKHTMNFESTLGLILFFIFFLPLFFDKQNCLAFFRIDS